MARNLADLGKHGGKAVEIGHRSAWDSRAAVETAVTVCDQLVHQVGFFTLNGCGVFLALAFVQFFQHGHRAHRPDVALHGRGHRGPGLSQRPARIRSAPRPPVRIAPGAP